MGLLYKALTIRDQKPQKKTAAGLLARALLYRKSLEAGLLRKANLLREGLAQSDRTMGLLARAEALHGTPVIIPVSGTPARGLLARAIEYGESGSKEGLLVKAGRLKAEPAGRGLLERAAEKMKVVPPAMEAAGAVVEIFPAEAEEETPVDLSEAVQVIEEHIETALPVEEEEVPAAEPEVEEAESRMSPLDLADLYLERDAHLDLLNLFSDILGSGGRDAFFDFLLDAFMRFGRGKAALLITPTKTAFRVRRSAGRAVENGPGTGKIRFGVHSAFIKFLHNNEKFLKSDDFIRGGVRKQADLLAAYEPWSVVTLGLGDYIGGFVLLALQPKRLRIDRDRLLEFARLASFHVCTEVMEKNLSSRVDKLEKERDELVSRLELYNFERIYEADFSAVLNHIAAHTGIASAVVAGGWDGRAVSVYGSTGVPESVLKRYRISKRDSGINAILRAGEPAIPEDFEERLSRLKTGDEDMSILNTFIVVPVLFNKEVLGALIVHKVRGAAGKVSTGMKKRLGAVAQGLVPYLLYRKMIGLEPFAVFESLLGRAAEKARKEKTPLHVVSFIIRNYKKVIATKGYSRYRTLLKRFHTVIDGKTGKWGSAYTVSLNRVVILITLEDDGKVAAVLDGIRSAVSALIERESPDMPISLAPKRTVYPNQSTSVAEIIQLVE